MRINFAPKEHTVTRAYSLAHKLYITIVFMPGSWSQCQTACTAFDQRQTKLNHAFRHITKQNRTVVDSNGPYDLKP
jgi:hypothetical protein